MGHNGIQDDRSHEAPQNQRAKFPTKHESENHFDKPNENTAMNLERRYIVDENNRKVAVQLGIETFEKIENILKNHALYELMQASEDDEELSLEDAMTHYQSLSQNRCN